MTTRPAYGALRDSARAVADVGPLLRFRAAGLRGHRTAAVVAGASVVALLLACAAYLPSVVPGAGTSPRAADLLLLLPTALVAFLGATTLAAVGSGGGRELLPRDQAISLPISPTTDHLGALLLAPLNVAWLLQAASLVGLTAYAVGPHGLLGAQLTVVVWVLAATATAQLVAWGVEWVRRGRGGAWVVRAVGVALGVGVAVLVARGQVTTVLDRTPTVRVVVTALRARDRLWVSWLVGTGELLGLGLVAAAVGAVVPHRLARRPPRDEQRLESRVRPALRHPTSDLAALIRLDRASVWRAVPLRRGLAVLALLPGLAAAAGSLPWAMLPVLPGLVASGGALLFGVNAWCLDGTGTVWRDSLPARPRLSLVARLTVLAEMLTAATLVAVVVAGLRAGGTPSAVEVSAIGCSAVVVTLQVVARSMHWSVKRPFPADLRSARATPAPPLAMAGYSARLALTSTLSGLAFSLVARAGDWRWAPAIAVPLVLFAVRRLVATAARWDDPDIRAKVVATVASG